MSKISIAEYKNVKKISALAIFLFEFASSAHLFSWPMISFNAFLSITLCEASINDTGNNILASTKL
ncbi:hypothetical protein SDC9_179437 [bioreactor metagenome]|uniref:Uncharacterized protein n=1 Tax=bioreactor metagenome TaxID=1076179 RepID=A0A645H0X5_9ZZZZ